MAPLTPQGNSRLPKSPNVGGPVPMSGLLGRRSLLPNPHTSHSSASASDYQAQMEFNHINSTGMAQDEIANSSINYSNNTASPLALRNSTINTRRPSAPREMSSGDGNQRGTPTLTSPQPGHQSNLSGGKYSRSNSLSGMSPPLQQQQQQQQQQQHMTSFSASSSSSSSPTESSPLARTSLTARLSTGGSSVAAARAAYMKQPLFQRPTTSPSFGGPPVLGSGLPPAGTLANKNSVASNLSTAHPPVASVSAERADSMPQVGDRVMVESMGLTGYLRFMGTAAFKSGVWAGIELDTPTGKNDGTVAGVAYFNCRPSCGIFVLAAKVVKTSDDMMLPFSQPQDRISTIASTKDTFTTPPPALQPQQQQPVSVAPTSQAAQAVSRISAGSRASKYIGMTATQLKQQRSPQATNTRLQKDPNATLSSTGATPNRTTVARPSPAPKVTTAAARPRPGQVSVTSQPTPTSRPRISPTPGRLTGPAPGGPRRLSVRSDTTDNGTMLTATTALDQNKLLQNPGSPQDNMAQQFQQLQLEFGVAIAENNMLKTEMNQTKSQLELNRLLEKRDLTYDDRVFLSKSLGRGGIDERLAQELEELHVMKSEWEKERQAKDQELKAMTEKMTQAWLDAAKSQKERTALVNENESLTERLKEFQENGAIQATSESDGRDQAVVELLQSDLEVAQQRAKSLESQLKDVSTRAAEDHEHLIKAAEEAEAAIEARFLDQMDMLKHERETLKSRLMDLEAISRSSTESLEAKLEEATRETTSARTQLNIVIAELEHEVESHHFRESVAEDHLKKAEQDLQEARALLAKSERSAKGSEDRTKEFETALEKKEQEIDRLKQELEDLAGMVQSDEVDRLRKVWEHERIRLEESASNDMSVIANLRAEIESLETNEEEYLGKITDLEEEAIQLLDAKANVEQELARLREQAATDEEQFHRECIALESKAVEATKALEIQAEESRRVLEKLDAMTKSVEEWKARSEELQSEVSHKATELEGLKVDLTDSQTKIESLDNELQEVLVTKKGLEEAISTVTSEHTAKLDEVTNRLSSLQNERDQLESKVSELETALSLAASAQTIVDSANTTLSQSELDEEISSLKQMVHDLTRENVTVANVNKKLMQEHDNLMEAHRHVETECLKLMDEVERLHSESLAADVTMDESSVVGDEAREAVDEILASEAKNPNMNGSSPKDTASNSSVSVIRLENILKEKQSLLDRLTQAHSAEMRDLRQRYVDLDRSKAYEIAQLNKELTDLESLIESKIFHEADLEEEVKRKQKQIDRLQQEIRELKAQLGKAGSSVGSPHLGDYRANSATPQQRNYRSPSSMSVSSMASTPPRRVYNDPAEQPFCEVCEVHGHDLISCTAVFGVNNRQTPRTVVGSSVSSTPVPSVLPMEHMEEELDSRPYCENCEEFGQHYTDQCPNESMT
ncbi:hypothetical protein BGZ93_004849 [Podila epicladia]|nr:hypothetical protein BGZ92_009112 [Podila epicladia]KAG0096220.1 hypothetical protein BGZ93_004849 [Podila epicladia]